MSEIFKRYLNAHVRTVSGAGVTGFSADGILRESEGQWLVVDNEATGRTLVRRDLVFYIESDPPADATATLPRSAEGQE